MQLSSSLTIYSTEMKHAGVYKMVAAANRGRTEEQTLKLSVKRENIQVTAPPLPFPPANPALLLPRQRDLLLLCQNHTHNQLSHHNQLPRPMEMEVFKCHNLGRMYLKTTEIPTKVSGPYTL